MSLFKQKITIGMYNGWLYENVNIRSHNTRLIFRFILIDIMNYNHETAWELSSSTLFIFSSYYDFVIHVLTLPFCLSVFSERLCLLFMGIIKKHVRLCLIYIEVGRCRLVISFRILTGVSWIKGWIVALLLWLSFYLVYSYYTFLVYLNYM